jgi:carbamate kinase
MSAGTLVLALGGNALAPAGERPTIANQFRHTRDSLAPVVEMARLGWRIAIVHGNGPQVGDSLARNELASAEVEPLPLGVLVAETAGWIGYMIQQSLQNALGRAGVARDVVTLITQTVVQLDDPMLKVPTKPIGHALTPARRQSLEIRGLPVAIDGKGNARRLTASPRPTAIVEKDVLRRLVAAGTIVVVAGGGGPPVYAHPALGWEGVDAVVDKDRTAAIIAKELDADLLLILTDVDAVYRDWGKPTAAPLRRLTAAEARALVDSDQLGAGSMRPKLEAALSFVESGGARATIARLQDGPAAMRGETGTTIVAEGQ